MEEDRRCYVVGHVPNEGELVAGQNAEVRLENVALDDVETRIPGMSFPKSRGEHPVDLDRDHATRALEELLGERPASGANLDDGLVTGWCQRIDDAREDARVAEKVLPQALSHRGKGTGIAFPRPVHVPIRSLRVRLPWQPKEPPLAVRIARTLERRGVGIQGLAVETHRGRATLRGVVTSDLAHDRAVEIARTVDGVESIDDLLSVIDPQSVRPRRLIRHEDCTAIYITQPGDTLPVIAERVLGRRTRWREIRDMNRGVAGRGVLAPGLRVRLPKSE